jgi:hypothetical protein
MKNEQQIEQEKDTNLTQSIYSKIIKASKWSDEYTYPERMNKITNKNFKMPVFANKTVNI